MKEGVYGLVFLMPVRKRRIEKEKMSACEEKKNTVHFLEGRGSAQKKCFLAQQKMEEGREKRPWKEGSPAQPAQNCAFSNNKTTNIYKQNASRYDACYEGAPQGGHGTDKRLGGEAAPRRTLCG